MSGLIKQKIILSGKKVFQHKGEEPMKYRCKKIDYTGCHPEIASHLQRGEAVWCRVWDENPTPDDLCGYVVNYDIVKHESPYHVEFDDGEYRDWFKYAEPIPQSERRLKKASEVIAECEARGMKFRYSNNSIPPSWYGNDEHIAAFMLADCGKSESKYIWPDWCWR